MDAVESVSVKDLIRRKQLSARIPDYREDGVFSARRIKVAQGKYRASESDRMLDLHVHGTSRIIDVATELNPMLEAQGSGAGWRQLDLGDGFCPLSGIGIPEVEAVFEARPRVGDWIGLAQLIDGRHVARVNGVVWSALKDSFCSAVDREPDEEDYCCNRSC
jgi:hypothetical protein